MVTDVAQVTPTLHLTQSQPLSTSETKDKAKVIVIGATGHIGTYLIPRLVEAGHKVVAISRGTAKPYLPHAAWKEVEHKQLNRDALEAGGSFGTAIRDLKPDVVIDNICFKVPSAMQLAQALLGHIGHFIHVGTIWTHGFSLAVPTLENAPKAPFGEYGIQKKLIEDYLLQMAHIHGFPATLVHPGYIVGCGWVPVNPAANFNTQVFTKIAKGEKLALANFGMETAHHVHADDIAALMMATLANYQASQGESFHAVSEQALTHRYFAEAMYRWEGQTPNLEFKPFAEWAKGETEEDAKACWEHISRSPNCSMQKAQRLLNFRPRFSSLQAVQESVTWLRQNGKL